MLSVSFYKSGIGKNGAPGDVLGLLNTSAKKSYD
jgi:hypothetical protein